MFSSARVEDKHATPKNILSSMSKVFRISLYLVIDSNFLLNIIT